MAQNYTDENIIYNSLLKFCLSDDYEEQKRLYQNSIEQIKDNFAVSQICEIEKLLKHKTNLEIIYAYQKGTERLEENSKPFDNNDLEAFCIENLDLNYLYCNNSIYNKLEEALKNKRNQLRDFAKSQIESDCIESLFEIYSFCNYEILKHSYFIGAVPNYIIQYDIKFNGNIMGEKLKKCRKDANLTQEALGELLNTERSNISNYERGNNKPPISVIIMYSKLFNISLLYLLYDTVPVEAKRMFSCIA